MVSRDRSGTAALGFAAKDQPRHDISIPHNKLWSKGFVSGHKKSQQGKAASYGKQIDKMCFVFTCGETEFSSYLKGYEGVQCRCHNCGNYSGHVVTRWPWFTFCFVPVIPLAFHKYEDIVCNICNFAEPLQNRPDVLAQHTGAGHELQQQPHQGGHPPGGGSQPGWGGGGGPPGPKANPPMQYG